MDVITEGEKRAGEAGGGVFDPALNVSVHPAAAPPGRNDLAVSSFTHPMWKADEVSPGSGRDAMRVAVVDQLSCILGRELGRNDPDGKSASLMLHSALKTPVRIENPGELVNEIVEAICRSSSKREATARVYHDISKNLAAVDLHERLAIILALMRESMSEMFTDLFQPPGLDRNAQKVASEGAFSILFDSKGNVLSMSIRVAKEGFGRFFVEELKKAEEQYRLIRFGLAPGREGIIARLFNLNLYLVDAKSSEAAAHNTNQLGLFEAYLSALCRYASEGMPVRVGHAERVVHLTAASA
jgi:hypothetical protein